MSRFKNTSWVGWFVAGVVVALVLVPTAVGADAFKFIGIQGTSTNQADVTPAGQLQVAEASPSALFQSPSTSFEATPTPIAVAPPGKALIVTILHVLQTGHFSVQSNSTCTGTQVGTYSQFVENTELWIEVNLTPGLVIPAGDALCASIGNNIQGSQASVSGYVVSASAVPAS